jgi:polar amino acid transport system substrate-binding protein
MQSKYVIWVLFIYCQSFALLANNAKQVTILADDGYPPYSYVENNELKGIYVDVVRAAAKLISKSYQVTLEGVPWKRALMQVKEGRVLGILPPYKHIADRDYIWPYSVAIMSETVVAYCQNEINIIEYFNSSSTLTLPPLPLNIGINSGYIIFSEEIIKAIADKRIVVWENKSTDANIMKLQSKRLDCYLNDRLAIQYELMKLSKIHNLDFDNVSESLIVMSQTGHIGYSDNEKFSFKSDFVLRMDKALSQVLNSAQYLKIVDQYIQQ